MPNIPNLLYSAIKSLGFFPKYTLGAYTGIIGPYRYGVCSGSISGSYAECSSQTNFEHSLICIDPFKSSQDSSCPCEQSLIVLGTMIGTEYMVYTSIK